MINIVQTVSSPTPKKDAEAFRFLLATEKGYSSTITREGRDYLVTASDGKSVLFVRQIDGLD